MSDNSVAFCLLPCTKERRYSRKLLPGVDTVAFLHRHKVSPYKSHYKTLPKNDSCIIFNSLTSTDYAYIVDTEIRSPLRE